MALVADCDLAITEDATGWIDLTSLNAPTQVKMSLAVDGPAAGTYVHPVYGIASITVDVASTFLIVQTTKGIDEIGEFGKPNDAQSITTQYERLSSSELGHVVGTDWTEWTKVGH